MKSIKKVLAGAVVAGALGSGLLFAAAPASAAAAPAWEPDPNGNGGTISFYDATGNQVTSGNNLAHLFEYAVASSPEDPAGFHKANVMFAFPNHLQPTSAWFVQNASASTSYPVLTGPASITSLPATTPVSHPGPNDANLTAALGAGVLDTSPGYANIMQVRLAQSGGTGYWTADISFDTATGTWSQVFPAVVASTTTTLAATPNPSTVGNTVTLNATVSPAAAAGTVQFKDGATNIGAPVTVAAGAASTTISTLTAGAHALSAVFTPTDATAFSASTGNFSATVNPPATATSTALTVAGGYLTAGSAATVSATVTAGATPVSAGSVAFYDNGSATPIPGTVDGTTTPGTYVLSLPTGFTSGGHSVVAKFTPTDVTVYTVSQSAAQSFLTQAPVVGACATVGSQCTATGNVQATVPVGTLVISTPYTAAAPLDLGTLALSADSKVLTAAKPFQHIVVTDTRSGNLPWTVQALASNLSDGRSNPNSVINAQNLGLTGVAKVTSGAGFTGILTATNNAAANGVAPADPGAFGLGGSAPHTVIAADHGLGSVDMSGTLTLIAPSSTEPGLFTGTITFTVG